MACKGLLRRVNAFRLAATAFFSPGAAVAVRSGYTHDVQQQGLVEFRVKVQAACGEGSQGFSVIAVTQGHEAHFLAVSGLVVVLETHFHGGFDGRRTVVGKIELAESLRDFFHQLLAQGDGRLVREVGEDDVLQGIKLVLDGLVDFRVGVPEQVAPPGADHVQIALPVHVVQVDSLPAFDHDGGQRFIVFHLGTGMPDVFQIFF